MALTAHLFFYIDSYLSSWTCFRIYFRRCWNKFSM